MGCSQTKAGRRTAARARTQQSTALWVDRGRAGGGQRGDAVTSGRSLPCCCPSLPLLFPTPPLSLPSPPPPPAAAVRPGAVRSGAAGQVGNGARWGSGDGFSPSVARNVRAELSCPSFSSRVWCFGFGLWLRVSFVSKVIAPQK